MSEADANWNAFKQAQRTRKKERAQGEITGIDDMRLSVLCALDPEHPDVEGVMSRFPSCPHISRVMGGKDLLDPEKNLRYRVQSARWHIQNTISHDTIGGFADKVAATLHDYFKFKLEGEQGNGQWVPVTWFASQVFKTAHVRRTNPAAKSDSAISDLATALDTIKQMATQHELVEIPFLQIEVVWVDLIAAEEQDNWQIRTGQNVTGSIGSRYDPTLGKQVRVLNRRVKGEYARARELIAITLASEERDTRTTAQMLGNEAMSQLVNMRNRGVSWDVCALALGVPIDTLKEAMSDIVGTSLAPLPEGMVKLGDALGEDEED